MQITYYNRCRKKIILYIWLILYGFQNNELHNFCLRSSESETSCQFWSLSTPHCSSKLIMWVSDFHLWANHASNLVSALEHIFFCPIFHSSFISSDIQNWTDPPIPIEKFLFFLSFVFLLFTFLYFHHPIFLSYTQTIKRRLNVHCRPPASFQTNTKEPFLPT